jgi:putative NADPH-quinone reductase
VSKTILINAHPKKEHNLSTLFCDTYAQTSTDEIRKITLNEIDFELNILNGSDRLPLEDELKNIQNLIKESDKIVLFFPLYNGGMPALLKGFFDRIIEPGFGFRYTKSGIPEKLLKGKKAEVFITMGSPSWYYKWFQHAPVENLLKHNILGLCGIKSKFFYFDKIRKLDESRLNNIKEKVRKIASI